MAGHRQQKSGSDLQCHIISEGRYTVLLCDSGNLYCEKFHAGTGRADRTADLQLSGDDRENCDRGDAGSHVRIPGCHRGGADCVVYHDHSAIDEDTAHAGLETEKLKGFVNKKSFLLNVEEK